MKPVYSYNFLEKIWIVASTKFEYYNKLYLLTRKNKYKRRHKFWSELSEWVLNEQMKTIRNY